MVGLCHDFEYGIGRNKAVNRVILWFRQDYSLHFFSFFCDKFDIRDGEMLMKKAD